MRILILVSVLIISMLSVSFQNQSNTKQKDHLISLLEKAENSKDLDLINSAYAENATIMHPDLMPIIGREAILSLYEFLWSRVKEETINIYQVDSTYQIENKFIEVGYSFVIGNNKRDSLMYKATFVTSEGEYQLLHLVFGDELLLENKLPLLIKPTGKYKVGQSIHYYERTNADHNRTLAFQIWYPSQPELNVKAPYQSIEVIKASDKFLGLPLFFNSYFSEMESNSFQDAPVVPNEKFPILLYNHGYGGFTSVYQTVFEDLASHGYIVVSVGHEDESALLIVEDGSVIANDSNNKFYKSRASELNGPTIGEWQDIILNSDGTEENYRAYQKLVELSPLHNESTRLWASDTKEVIKKLYELNNKNHLLKGAFDLESIGVFGHSVGGATAGQMAMNNSIIKAGINLDGFQFGDLVNNNLEVPFMFVSSNQNGNSYLRASTFMNQSKTNCYQAVIKGFSHSSFTDLEYFNPGGKKVIELQRDLIRSFFDKYLKSSDIKLKELENKHAIISITTRI